MERKAPPTAAGLDPPPTPDRLTAPDHGGRRVRAHRPRKTARMLFCTWDYAKFFALVFAVYWAMPWRRARVGLLLAASFYFYACWNRWLALLDRLDLADGLPRRPRPRRERVASRPQGAPGRQPGRQPRPARYFKYANFFLGSLEARPAPRAASAASLPLLQVILPIGISFYTFEAINYTVDVYRRRIRAERNLAHFLLFILFFPHLVAGPIVRARDFLPQIRRPKRWDWARAELGVGLFLLGLFKKLAIADRMALFADPVFADPAAYGIARRLAGDARLRDADLLRLLRLHRHGPRLGPPARLQAGAELQHAVPGGQRRRSSGGAGTSRCRPGCATTCSSRWAAAAARGWQTGRNLLMTMTLGGLWHGASWTFVVWGAPARAAARRPPRRSGLSPSRGRARIAS